MRQIKMVIRPVERADEFDSEVNKLLRRGWRMKRRETLSLPTLQTPMLYAELERDFGPLPDR